MTDSTSPTPETVSPTPETVTRRSGPADFPPGQLAVPCVPWMWTESAAALLALRDFLPPGCQIAIQGAGPSSIAASRNGLVEALLQPEHPRLEWQLTIDSDMVPRPDTPVRLLTIAEMTGADVVSALYFTRALVHVPAVQRTPGRFVRLEELATLQGIHPVARVGLGCCLIRRRVFEALGHPWFQHPPAAPGAGEDFHFCDRVRALGFTIVVDFDFECGHLAVLPVTRELALAWHATPSGRRQAAGDYVAGTWREGAFRTETFLGQ